MSYDLFLQSPRGTFLPFGEAKRLLEDFRNETNLDGPCEITDFVTEQVAFPSDVETLEECFRDGEFSRSEYEAFCTAHQLAQEADSQAACRAARLYLDYKWGQKLFSPSLPCEDGEVRKAYRLIINYARRHNLVVHDPQLGQDIDLDNPGEFPPRWKPNENPKEQKRGWVPWRRGGS